ncbi:MAG: hypothetical protein R3B06_20580 [Kofleriaceae bacterium]
MSWRWLMIVAALVGLASPAVAEPVTVGVYAPTVPFEGTAARLAFATTLARHLAGPDAVGRVYGRASDFSAALVGGDIQLAVVDVAFLATTKIPHTTLAVAVRAGATAAPWQLVVRAPAPPLATLRGKTVVAPITDGQHRAFVDHALFGGELAPDFWHVEASPDTLSAVAAVVLGKADAAVVPVGLALPGDLAAVTDLPSVSWPILIAARSAPAEVVTQARAQAPRFAGAAAITGFRPADAEVEQALARRLRRPLRLPPLVVPALRITVGELLVGRRFDIARPAVTSYLPAP